MKVDGFRGLIFDMDGTMLDSMGMWHEIDVEYLSRFGLETPPDLQRSIEGLSFSEVAVYFKERFGIPDSVEEIGNTWLAMSRQKYLEEVHVKPGLVDFLTEMKARGVRTGVASSNHLDLIEATLIRHGLRDYFDVITTCDDVSAGKPDPAVYLKTAEKLGLMPSECLVFEDIPLGIEAGKRAGMTVYAVDDEYSRPVEEEKRAMADGYFYDYRELL